MRVIKMRIKMVIVLIVLVQATILTPMVGNLLKVVADNLLDGMDSNLLKVVNNHLKVASKNLLAMDDLITLHLRIPKLASR